VPYGCLVPRNLDGLLVAGRHISCDTSAHSFMREIPQCWMTGQAAGTAASLAVACNVAPRSVPVPELQARLLRQGVMLRPRTAAETPTSPAPIQVT
jgi:FAD dependent oxidoreductase